VTNSFVFKILDFIKVVDFFSPKKLHIYNAKHVFSSLSQFIVSKLKKNCHKRKEKKKPLMTSTLIAYKKNFCCQNSKEKTYTFMYIFIIGGPMMVVRCYLHSKWPNCEGPQASGLHKLLHANVLAFTTQNRSIYASQRPLKSMHGKVCLCIFVVSMLRP
jgi:hypothetical protein